MIEFHAAESATLARFAAAIAHEVNQPLAGVVTNAATCLRLLAGDPPNVEEARETARRAIRDGNRASEMIARLRALFSRTPSPSEPVDLNDLTREALVLSGIELERERAVLRLDLASDLPAVMGNRIQLQQVILNLVRNALDAMRDIDDRPRRVVVSTARETDRAILSVRDAGIGLDLLELERIFDPFFTTKENGMGIGLCVSRSIIYGHHGSLWAARNDGPGITVSFSIPYAGVHA